MAEQDFQRLGEEGPGHFPDYLMEIWRRKRLVLLVALAVFGLWMWNTLRKEPLYEAVVTVQLGVSIGSGMLERTGALLGGSALLETELEILKSRTVAEKTALRLKKHYSLKTVPPGVSLELSGVTVGGGFKPGWYTIGYIDDTGNYQVNDPDGKVIGVGQSGRPFNAEDISFTISSKPIPNKGSTFQVLVRDLAAVANGLRGQLSVTVLRGTNIVNLRVKTNNPKEASRLANAFAEAYVNFSREQKLQQVLSLRDFVEKQLGAFREDMLKTQQELAEKTVQSPFGVFKRGREGTIAADDPRYVLARRLLDLELQRGALQYTLTPNHRLIGQIDREIASIRGQLSEQWEGGKQDSSLQELMRESSIKIDMYNYLLQKQHELRLAEASELGSARVIDRALTPAAPIFPDVSRSVKAGALFGLTLAIGSALLLGRLDRSIRPIKDIQRRLGLSVFGVIPDIGCEDCGNRLRLWSRKRESADAARLLVGGDSQAAQVVEAYRSLRTHIRFAVSGVSSRILLFTSPGPGEGKSLTVANLAIAMSQQEGRILVADCDLRKPDQSKLFEVAGQAGISEVLAGERTWREVTQPTRFKNIDVLPCGGLPPDPAELIAQHAMKEFLEEAQKHYSLVLIDSPPALPFTDACVLAPLVSGVLLVVRSRVTSVEAITRVKSMLNTVGARSIAVILNGVCPADEIRYYGYYSYYKKYGASGKSQARGIGWIRKIAQHVLRHLRNA